MKHVGALTACLLLASACGCTWWRKPAAAEMEIAPPGECRDGPLVHMDEEFVPLPLQFEAPVAELSYTIPHALQRPPHVAGGLDVTLRRTWKYIVIHHSGTDRGSEAIFDRYHRMHNGWRGVGYDFVIGNGRGSADGLVEVTFRWEKQMDGAHAGTEEHNKYGIGICLVGDFEKSHPTARQMEAVVGLVNYLQERCRIPTRNVLFHRHIRPGGTRCPGRNFPFYEFLALLAH